MKELTLCYKTNEVAPIIGIDSVDEGKAIIDKLTKNAQKTNSKFDSVEFFIDNLEGEILYTSPRFITSTVEDINNVDNLRV